MHWLARVFGRVPFGAHIRRALGETLADWRHESRSPHLVDRLGAAAGALAAVTRVLLHALGSFDERPLSGLGRDIRVAWRRLGRSPGYAAFAIATLALGIGATTAVYSMVRTVTGPASGVANADRLVNLYNWRIGGSPYVAGLSWPDYQDLRARQTSFESLMTWSLLPSAIAGDTTSTSGIGEIVSGNYFDVLGVQPALGRLLVAADDEPDAPLVAVLSHAAWRRLYAESPNVVGRAVHVNGQAFQVVGVAPREFRGLYINGLVPELVWVPNAAARVLAGPGMRMTLDPDARDSRWLMVKGVLAPGVSLEQASVEVEAVGSQLDVSNPIGQNLERPTRSQSSRTWILQPMADAPFETEPELVAALSTALTLAMAIVLLVACTNLTNFAVARGSARRHETTLRYALGASRWRLVREQALESMILTVAGGVAGLGVARVIMLSVAREMSVSGAPVSLYLEPHLDLRAVGVAAAAAGTALLVAGVGPALFSTRANLRGALATEAGGALPRWRGRRYLITAQVAASAVLLSVAALAGREVRGQLRHDPGFDLDRLAVARVRFEPQGYDQPNANRVLESVRSLLEARADVAAVSLASDVQAVTGTDRVQITLPEEQGTPTRRSVDTVSGSPGLLDTLGVRLLHGRAWTDADGPDGAIVLSDRAAISMFGASNVVGRTVFVARPGSAPGPATVIGVAADTDSGFYGYGSEDGAMAYLPMDEIPLRESLIVVRSADDDATALVGALRQAFASVEPRLALDIADTGRRLAGALTLFYSIIAGIASLLGTFAWVLALGGLYGVLSHLVYRRTREIGVRVALGARHGQILGMVVREGLSPVLLGVIGAAVFGGVARWLVQPQLARLAPSFDLVGLTPIFAAFLGAAFLACYLPARRAAAVDPTVALRQL